LPPSEVFVSVGVIWSLHEWGWIHTELL